MGGGAAAVALQDGEKDSAEADRTTTSHVEPEMNATPTPPTEMDSLGLPRLDPASILNRETHGRLRVVPAGGPIEWDSAFEPQANLQAGESPARKDGAAGLPTRDGGPFEPMVPAGFGVASMGSLGKLANGERTFVSGGIVISKEGETRPITLEYWQLKPDAVVEVTAFSASGVWDISATTGTTGFLQAMSPGAGFESVLNADFVIGSIYFRLRAPGATPAELLAIVSAIRDEMPE